MAKSKKRQRKRSNRAKRGSPYPSNTQKSKPGQPSRSQKSSPPRKRQRGRDTSSEDTDGDTHMPSPSPNRSSTTSPVTRSPQPPFPTTSSSSSSSQRREDPAPRDCPTCELMQSRAASLRDTLAALATAQAGAIDLWAGPSVVAADQPQAPIQEKKTADSMDWQQDCALPVRIVTDVPELRCYPREIVRWPEVPSSLS